MTALQAIGWGLVHFLWQGALIALVLRIILALCGRTTASVRYTIAVVGMLSMPVVVGYTIIRDYQPSSKRSTVVDTNGPLSQSFMTIGQTASPPPNVRPADRLTAPLAGSQPIVALALERVRAALPEIASFWLIGVAMMGLWHLLGWRTARRLVVRNTSPAPAIWLAVLDRLVRQLGISQPVRFLVSTTAQVPAVVGWLRPVVVAPFAALSGLTPIQLELLLAHELAHVKRYDYVVNLVQCFIESLLFYHPAVWWISARIRDEREHCCDDLAISVHGDPITYAEALFAMEQLRLSSPSTPALAASGGSLLGRIRRLLEGSRPSQASSRWAAGLLLAAGASITMASVHWAQSPGKNLDPSNAAATRENGDTIDDRNAQEPLAERFRAAQRQGKGKRQFWIGYSVNSTVAFTADSTGQVGLLPQSPLYVILGYSQRDGSLQLEEIHTSWDKRPDTPRGRTMYWIGSAGPDESLELLQALSEGSSPEEQELLMAARNDHSHPAPYPMVDAAVLASPIGIDTTGNFAITLDSLGYGWDTTRVFVNPLLDSTMIDLRVITDSLGQLSDQNIFLDSQIALLDDQVAAIDDLLQLHAADSTTLQHLDELNVLLADSAIQSDAFAIAQTLSASMAHDTIPSPAVTIDTQVFSLGNQGDTTDIVAALRALLPKLRSERAKQLTRELINELNRLNRGQLHDLRIRFQGDSVAALPRGRLGAGQARFHVLQSDSSGRAMIGLVPPRPAVWRGGSLSGRVVAAPRAYVGLGQRGYVLHDTIKGSRVAPAPPSFHVDSIRRHMARPGTFRTPPTTKQMIWYDSARGMNYRLVPQVDSTRGTVRWVPLIHQSPQGPIKTRMVPSVGLPNRVNLYTRDSMRQVIIGRAGAAQNLPAFPHARTVTVGAGATRLDSAPKVSIGQLPAPKSVSLGRTSAIAKAGARLDRAYSTADLRKLARESDDPAIREEALETLLARSPSEGFELIPQVLASDPDLSVRLAAVQGLRTLATTRRIEVKEGSIGPVELLIKVAFQAKHEPQLQRAAVVALGDIGTEASLAGLAHVARVAPNPTTRAKAILMYGQQASSRDAVQVLAELIKTEQSVDCQRAILGTLAGLGESGVDALIEVARRHPNKAVRKLAISYWAEIDEEEAAKELKNLPQ